MSGVMCVVHWLVCRYYTAYNLSRAAHDPHPVTNRVGLMGFPLWAGLASTDQVRGGFVRDIYNNI
jgi:hypothetical protein